MQFFVFWINRSREMAGIEIACSEYAVNGMTEMRSSAYTHTFLWQSVRITLCRKWLCANPAVPPPGTMAGRRCCPGRLQCDPRISRGPLNGIAARFVVRLSRVDVSLQLLVAVVGEIHRAGIIETGFFARFQIDHANAGDHVMGIAAEHAEGQESFFPCSLACR